MKSPILCVGVLMTLISSAIASSHIEATYLEPKEYTDFEFRDRSEKSALKSFDLELSESRDIKRALGEGRQLKIQFHDINLAGQIRMNSRHGEVRVIRSIFPPKLDFTYSITDSEGNVLLSGEERLSDISFQNNIERRLSHETFFYELELLEAWLKSLQTEAS